MVDVERVGLDFGARMKRARESSGVTLRQIAETTKISVAALEALERNDIARLPGGIFSRALVRAYAGRISLDPEQTVREFLAQFPQESLAAAGSHVWMEKRRPAHRRYWLRAMLALGAVVLTIAALVAYMSFVGSR
jgi:cytoskeletal protein RodZ